jgi:hypothetical protein
MALDLTSFDAALKQHYTSDRVEDMVYKRNPFLALVTKMENFGGKNLPVPIIYGNPQGRSKTFTNAKTRGAATSSKITDFVLTRSKDYSIATIDNETLEASKGDQNAFMTAATTEVDGAINSLTRSIAVGVFRDESAAIGQVLAEPSNSAGSFVVTVKQNSDITNFEVGMIVVIWSAKTAGTQRNSDGSDVNWEIEAIDRDAGTITLTGTYDGSGTIAANDYLFVEGDRGLGVSGLASWVPDTAPTSTLFFGVDRSVDVTRLGGLRLDGSGAPIEEVLIEGDAMIGREGQYIDHYFMNPKKLGDLKKALGTKVQYVNLQANARVSFSGIMIDGEKGPINCLADFNCPYDRCYGLAMEYWKLYSLGKAVRVIDTDGLQMLRQDTSDGVEVRYGFYGNLATRAPGSNIVIKF